MGRRINGSFSLYRNAQSKLESTVFDLISGDNETKQTKGLAYILAQCPDLAIKIIEEHVVPEVRKKRGFSEKPDFVDVSAELIASGTKNKQRADIVLKCYAKQKPLLAVVFEAKAISKGGTNGLAIQKQLGGYLNTKTFPELNPFKKNKVGVMLTRNQILGLNHPSITWSDLLATVHEFVLKNPKSSKVAKEYYDFATNIGGAMKYYEREVLSVPAAATIALINRHGVYSCPDSYSYMKPLFMAFRARGGAMEHLYSVQQVVTFNPYNGLALKQIKASVMAQTDKDRLLAYIKDLTAPLKPKGSKSIKEEELRFYLLDSNPIKLDPSKKPSKPQAAGHIYYSLKAMLGKTEKVRPSKG